MLAIKLNKLSLNGSCTPDAYEPIKNKLQIENVASYYQIFKLFSLQAVCETTTFYFERCFAMVVETKNFMELAHHFVSKILASSRLAITCEVEVYIAAKNWLHHEEGGGQRGKFAKDLLLKVRFGSLSHHTVELILNDSPPFSKNAECVELLREVHKLKLANKHQVFNPQPARQCQEKVFNIFVCQSIVDQGLLLSKKAIKRAKHVVFLKKMYG